MNNQMSSQRQIRYAELIRSLISDCLLKEDFFVEGIDYSSVTVSFVKMSKDLKIANIYLSTLKTDNQKLLIKSINQNKYIFQRFLSNAKIKSKFTPKINFFIDDTFDEANKIEKLLANKKVRRDLNE
tara:strand:+ start:144 stop:524 length:381 start_codon:yes stop_codon:yes gene_type:complete